MQFTMKLVGTKPLLLHNVDLANPRNLWYRKIAELRGTPSAKRTDKWLDEMEYAMFMGAFYEIPEITGVGIPCENVRQSLIEAAKITRDGPRAKRCLMLSVAAAPLIYEGPRTPQELWETGKFSLTRMIRGTGGASPTTWPVFHEWALRVPMELDDGKTGLSLRDLTDIAERAGRIVGLGASRKQGYGRFDALVET